MKKTTNRVIAYKKPSESVVVVTTAEKKEPETKDNAETLKELPTAESIIKWIKDHEYFKWTAMCKKVGLDFGNFYRTMKSDSPTIKPEYVPEIIEILKKYGYAQ